MGHFNATTTFVLFSKTVSPFQVLPVDGRVADGALSPRVIGEGEVVQDAGPAEHVAAACYLCCSWWIQAVTKVRKQD